MQLSTLIEAVAPDAGASGARRSTSPPSPTAPRPPRPGSLHVCVPGFTADGHDFAPGGRRATGPCGAGRRARARRGRAAARGRLVAARRWRSAADAFYGHPERRPRRRRRHGHERQDDHGLPRCTRCSRRRRAGPGCSARSSRASAAPVEPVARTTPESVDLQATLRRMVDAGDLACAMEVSSHALDARPGGRRAASPPPAFTNLTQDHLDFHPDMEDYFAAKAGCSPRRPPARSTSTIRTAAGWRAMAGGRRCSPTRARATRTPTCARTRSRSARAARSR